MSDEIQGKIIDKFFDPVINAEDLDDLREWLKDQPTTDRESAGSLTGFN